MITQSVWRQSDPRVFQGVLNDLRSVWASRDPRHYKELADDLGYAMHTKVVGLRTAGDRLLADAEAGDVEARLRVRRADALGDLLRAEWWGEATPKSAR